MNTAELPATVAETARSLGHDLTPTDEAHDETHACTRCTARAYPTPGQPGEWIGWAIEYTCAQVAETLGAAK